MTTLINGKDGWSIDAFKDTLVSNASCTVNYVDGSDGSVQTINCTLEPSTIPADAGSATTPYTEDNPVYVKVYELSVWNLDSSAWTRIDMGSVVSIKYGE